MQALGLGISAALNCSSGSATEGNSLYPGSRWGGGGEGGYRKKASTPCGPNSEKLMATYMAICLLFFGAVFCNSMTGGGIHQSVWKIERLH